MNNNVTPKSVFEFGVLRGRRNRPTSMWGRLISYLPSHRWRVRVRTAVWELGMLLRRIGSVANAIPGSHLPQPIPADPRPGHSSLDFALACNEGTRKINREFGLGSYLDRKIYCQAFAEGVEFAVRTQSSSEDSEDHLAVLVPSEDSIRNRAVIGALKA